ncbi:MAG: energy transducer TonB [Bacteroidales bacterium]|nr:energy transducer TonB [Bacteroidales bacterium]
MKRILILLLVLATGTFANGSTPQKKAIGEFLRMSRGDTTFCELTGVVSRIRNYERSRLFLTDATGTVFIYGVSDADGNGIPAYDVRKGDTLTLRGWHYVYKGVIEIRNARYVSHKKGPGHDSVPKFDELDKDPVFQGGGLKEFGAWISSHIKRPAGVTATGEVRLKFVIGFNGAVLEPEIVKGLEPALNAEVLRVARKAPKWKPGLVNNKPVRVTYTVNVKID